LVRAGTRGPIGPVLWTWAQAILIIAAAALLARVEPTGLLQGNLAGVGALVFLWLPDRRLRARGEEWEAYGLHWWGAGDRRTWAAWGRGALWAAGTALLVFPLFALGFLAFAAALPGLPEGMRALLAPYAGAPRLVPRLPEGFALQALLQLLVVALPEEAFYRGFVQGSLRRLLPGRPVRLLGAELGPGFLLTQALFAAGHLASFQPFRLATFFPGLLFGWLRERTGGLAAPVLFHALSNLLLKVLEASLYG
jgi:membrane protease YdiL (CAAX protease family)